MTEHANTCVYCGASLGSEAIVCDTCGKPVYTPQPAQPVPPVFIAPFTIPPENVQPAEQPVAPPAVQPVEQPAAPPAAQPAQPSTPPPAQPAQPYSPPPPQGTPDPTQPVKKTSTPAKKGGLGLPIILGGIGCIVVMCIIAMLIAAVLFVNSSQTSSNEISPVVTQLVQTQEAMQTPTGDPMLTEAPIPTFEPLSTEAGQATPASQEPVPGGEGNWSADIGQELTDTQLADNFSSNTYGWAETDDETRTWGIVDQRYVLHLKTAEYVAWAYLPIDFTPVVVGFDAALVPGFEQGAYGVLCHYQDQDNYHYVAIDPVNHEFAIGKFVNNEDTMLMDDWWKPSLYLQSSETAVNQVKVICRTDKISLYINNQLETEVVIDAATPGNTAVYAETWDDLPAEGFKVQFDNLYANTQEQ